MKMLVVVVWRGVLVVVPQCVIAHNFCLLATVVTVVIIVLCLHYAVCCMLFLLAIRFDLSFFSSNTNYQVLSLSLHNEILYKAQVKQKVNIGQIQRSTDDCLYILPTKVLNYGFLKNPQIPK